MVYAHIHTNYQDFNVPIDLLLVSCGEINIIIIIVYDPCFLKFSGTFTGTFKPMRLH